MNFRIQLPIFFCLILVNFDPALAGSLKQLWNKLKYDNQRLDYYQPYASFNNYLPAPNYQSPLSNFNVMNTPLIESASLQRPIVSLPSNLNHQQQQQQQQSQHSNLKGLSSNNIPTVMSANLPNNLMTAESINNQFGVLPQQLPSMQQLPPEFFYDFNQKTNGYPLDSLRNLNGLGQAAGLPSLTSLTPLLLLSSLGTLSSKSLAHTSPLTPSVSNSFIKSLTTYLTSYLPASPRQRKRQIDRNLPINVYPLKKSMTPFDQFTNFQQPLQSLSSSPKVSSTVYEANMKKHLYFGKKKPVKYIKPKWKMDAQKKSYNLKKHNNKNQIKYSKLMNESGFVSKQNQTGDRQSSNKFSNNQQRSQQMKYSEPDRYLNKPQTVEQPTKDEHKEINKDQIKSTTQEDQTNSRSANDQQNDKQTEKVNDAKLNDGKLNEESTATEFRTEQEGQKLTSNQPQTDLEDFAEQLYR